MKKQVKNTESRLVVLRRLARKATNKYLTLAHTKTLVKLLSTFNYHYSTRVERTREELIELVKVERNRVLWGNEVVA